MAVSISADADAALPARVEEAGLNNLHTRRQLLYDGWILFLSPGKAKRARSVNAHFASRLPLTEKIAYCESAYASRALPALFRVTPFSQPAELDATLAERGYVAFDETLVQRVPLTGLPRLLAPPGTALTGVTLESFVDAVGTLRGSPALQRAAHLERVAASPLDIVPIVVHAGGMLAGAGMLSADGRLAGLFDIVVAPAMQRRGIASAIVATLLERAIRHGVREAYLQVTADNVPAVALYRRFGFSTLYRYHYRARAHEVE